MSLILRILLGTKSYQARYQADPREIGGSRYRFPINSSGTRRKIRQKARKSLL